MFNLCTKFEDYSFSRSRDRNDDLKFKKSADLEWLRSLEVIRTIIVGLLHSIFISHSRFIVTMTILSCSLPFPRYDELLVESYRLCLPTCIRHFRGVGP